MNEKKGSIFPALFFGISSIAILLLTWTRPMSGAERVLSTLIGGVGVLIAMVKARRLLSAREMIEVEEK